MEPEIVEPRRAGVNLDFRLLLKWLKQWKWIIGGVTAIAVAYAAITGSRDKPIYGAEARLLLTNLDIQSADNPLAMLVGDNNVPLNIIRGVLESRESRMMIAERSGVTYEDVKKKLTVLPEGLTKQLLIQARKESTETNLKMVEATIEVLEIRSGELQLGPAGAQAELIRASLDKREEELTKAEDQLAAFSKTMVSGPDATAVLTQLRQLELEYGAASKALEAAEERVKRSAGNSLDIPSFLPGTEELRRTIIQRRLDLATLEQSLGPGNPLVVKAKRDVKIAEDTLNAEVRKYISSVDMNVDPATAELAGRKTVLEWQVEEARRRAKLAPDEAMNFSRLTREVAILNGTVTQLRTQYETAKIQADTQKLTWTTLDKPYTRDDRENSLVEKIIKYFFAGFFGGAFVSWLLGLLLKPRKRSF